MQLHEVVDESAGDGTLLWEGPSKDFPSGRFLNMGGCENLQIIELRNEGIPEDVIDAAITASRNGKRDHILKVAFSASQYGNNKTAHDLLQPPLIPAPHDENFCDISKEEYEANIKAHEQQILQS